MVKCGLLLLYLHLSVSPFRVWALVNHSFPVPQVSISSHLDVILYLVKTMLSAS